MFQKSPLIILTEFWNCCDDQWFLARYSPLGRTTIERFSAENNWINWKTAAPDANTKISLPQDYLGLSQFYVVHVYFRYNKRIQFDSVLDFIFQPKPF